MSKWTPKSEEQAREEGHRLRERFKRADIEDTKFILAQWALLEYSPTRPEGDEPEQKK